MNTRILEKPAFLLLYTDTDLSDPGQIYWNVCGPYATDTEAVTALLGTTHMTITMSRVVEVSIPTAVMPNSLKQIPGQVVELQDEPEPDIVMTISPEVPENPLAKLPASKSRRFAPSAATATPPSSPEDREESIDG